MGDAPAIRAWISLVENSQQSSSAEPAATLCGMLTKARLPARFDVYQLDASTVELTNLEAVTPGKGQGRDTMNAILAMADNLGVTVELWPVWDDAIEGGLHQDALLNWYLRLGFGFIPNRDPDEEDREIDRYLVRPPSTRTRDNHS